MNKFITILFILLLLDISASFGQSNKYEYCDVDIDQLSLSSWEKCNGKPVKVNGRVPDFVMQHPVGLHDTLDINTGNHNRKYETYVDIGGQQAVLSSKEKIECNECIDIEGIVDIVDLGGGEGTKGSYKNVWIKVLNYSCKKCEL